ncbi:orotidine 5'-phosphate decarboxylase / HUMPS family protein, partial [Staphylococcus saprophyticus]
VVTILGVAEDASIKAAVEEAHKNDKQLLVDMIAVQDIKQRAKELDEMGADYIAVHIGYDLQAEGKSPLDDLHTVKSV